MSAWYKTGTATATNASTAVTGASTAWTANAFIGDGIRFGTEEAIYEIAAVGGNTSITLASAYAGTTGSGKSYVIIPMSTARKQVSNLMASVGSLLSTLALGAANTFGISKTSSAAAAMVQFVNSGIGVGRVGTIGSDAVTLETSTDGSTWTKGISINATTGKASFPSGFDSAIGFTDGSAAAPAITFATDTDTGIYSDSANAIGFATGGTLRMTLASTGRLGIGTTSPTTSVHTVGGGVYIDTEDAIGVRCTSGQATSANTSSNIIQRRSRGTIASPSAVLSGDRLGANSWNGYGASGWLGASGTILVIAAENFTDAAGGVTMRFSTSILGATAAAERMRITENGQVAIGGTTSTTALQVHGAVRVASTTVAGLPSAATEGAGAIRYASNETGGAVIVFSDGTNWRRVTDRAIAS